MTPFDRPARLDFGRGLLWLALTTSPLGCAVRRDTIRDWAQDVVLSPEYGSQDGRVVRWAHRPRVGVFGATSAEVSEIEWVVTHLAEVLSGTSGEPIMVGTDPPLQVDIEVHSLRLAEFGRFARGHGFTYEPGNHGYFWMFWDQRHRLQRAYVLLASDVIAVSSLRHYALEELTQSLGFAGDTSRVAQSIFFSRAGSTGSAYALSALDRQLLRFVYTAVPPGADRSTFLTAFEQHWPH